MTAQCFRDEWVVVDQRRESILFCIFSLFMFFPVPWRIIRETKCEKIVKDARCGEILVICAPKGSGKTELAIDLFFYIRKIGARSVYVQTECRDHSSALAVEMKQYIENEKEETEVFILLDGVQELYNEGDVGRNQYFISLIFY